MHRLFAPSHTERCALYVSLSLFSVIGELLRIVLEQILGGACHATHPVDWNRSDWAPCTTDPGTTTSSPDGGGAMFIDLPANMLGCFIIGLFISGDEYLGIPIDIPVVFLNRDSKLQDWSITLTGIRTGLCGSLTTFASWNTQMVVMICGGRWVSALFGYFVGLGMAFYSFQLGRQAAVAAHRYNNPDLAIEADKLAGRKPGAYALVHRSLPDYERRLLNSITLENSILRKELHDIEEEYEKGEEGDSGKDDAQTEADPNIQAPSGIRSMSSHFLKSKRDPLQRWKETTDNHRHGRVTGEQWHTQLQELENAVLLRDEDPRDELLELARDAGWDLGALMEWKDMNTTQGKSQDEHLHRIVGEFTVLGSMLAITVGLLIWGAISAEGSTEEQTDSYKVSLLSALVAPAGTFCRYMLSDLNGTITNRRWEWLPIGTLMANLSACVISALMVGLKVQGQQSDTVNIWLGAIKGGFAGCLSTVSTFITESSGLMRALPRHAWGYYYCYGTMTLACICGVCSYVWAVV